MLTDLRAQPPGLRRLAHGYATSGTWRRLLYRGGSVAREVLLALPRDAAATMRPRSGNLLRVEAGGDMAEEVGSLLLYVHYAPNGRISDMVRRQIGLLRGCGFSVVFITMSAPVPEADWQAVRQMATLMVQRRNVGRDFGAWRDVVPEVRRRFPALRELMLANDSVLGPVHPLKPLVAALRGGGNGLFGLTESRQGGPHLQSYLLLARGPDAVGDLLTFLDGLFITRSKWLLVQLSEIRLARWMLARGHRVAALFGYGRVIEAAAADETERARLAASHVRLRHLERLPQEQAAALLWEWPLNPTQHLWHVLLARMQMPFIKTELVRRNPGRLPGLGEWPDLVPPDAPCPLPVLRAHLAGMGP